MEWNLTTIGLLIAVLIIGYLIGLVEASLKAPKKDKDKPANGEGISALDDDVEVLRAWRSIAGKLRLDMDGQKIENGEALQPEQRRRLVNLLIDLRPWLEAATAAQPGKTIREHPQTPPAALPPNLATEKPAAPPATDFVAQVDAVLQKKLAGTPLATRRIHLEGTPTGGVMVFVGLQRYEGLDAVPEAEIKDLIRLAVAEWENEH